MNENEYSDDYAEIKSIMEGTDPGRGYVSDNLRVRFNKNNPAKSLANITLDIGDFIHMIEDSLYYAEDDKNIILNLFGGYYGPDYEFMSWESASEDWEGGYILRRFDNQNIELLKEILKYSPTLIDITDNESIVQFLSKKEFEGEIDWITTEYQDLYNQCGLESLKEYIMGELSNKLLPYNIIEKFFMKNYYTTVGNLYRLYNEHYVSPRNSVLGLFKILLKKQIGGIGGYHEEIYGMGCRNFDDESLNIEIHRQLEKILEKIEEDMEDEEFDRELVERTLKYIQSLKGDSVNGKMRYFIPTMPTKFFMIDNINFIKGIEITIYNKNNESEIEKRLIKFEDFPTFIENYKLFESKRQKKFFLIK